MTIKDRNRIYKEALDYFNENDDYPRYICHHLDQYYFGFEYKKVLKTYPELKLLFPVDFDGYNITSGILDTKGHNDFRKNILMFAIEMTE